MSDENKSGIYCIENIINNKKYIGQSKDIKNRWQKHISELQREVHYNRYLQHSWNKYGEDVFSFYVLEYCNFEDLDDKERYYISLYNTIDKDYGYNLKHGGQNGGGIYTKEASDKLSESIKKSYENSDLKLIRKKKKKRCFKSMG